MKRIYFFVAGGLILASLLGFWLYSFLYGNPQNGDQNFFTNLGIFGQDNSEVIVTPEEYTLEELPAVDVVTEQLRQLTTKPVVGMRIVDNGTSTMRYVEAGTGHIFDISLSTGQENRVSNISVPVASEAAISPSGNYVAIRSGFNNNNELVLVDLSDLANPTSTILPNQVESFAFAFNNELLFTEFSGGQTEGKAYLPSTKNTRRLFTVPFTAHAMAWSNSSSSNHIIYTKPAASMLGYAYELAVAGPKRLTPSGFGLTVAQSNGIRFIGHLVNEEYNTAIIDKAGRVGRSPGASMPEKCTANEQRPDTMYCASPITAQNPDLPDAWYQGEYQFDDYLWEVKNGGSTLLTYPKRETGRPLDITQLQLSPNGRMLYFTNKTDRTLWLYEI